MNLLVGVGLNGRDEGLGNATRTDDPPTQAWDGVWVDNSRFWQPHSPQFRAVSCNAPIAAEEDYVWQIHNLLNPYHPADSHRL